MKSNKLNTTYCGTELIISDVCVNSLYAHGEKEFTNCPGVYLDIPINSEDISVVKAEYNDYGQEVSSNVIGYIPVADWIKDVEAGKISLDFHKYGWKSWEVPTIYRVIPKIARRILSLAK